MTFATKVLHRKDTITKNKRSILECAYNGDILLN